MATMTALSTVTVGAGGAASINFTSIPQTYTDLVMVISAKSNRADSNDWCYVTINGSNTTEFRMILGEGTGVSSYTSSSALGVSTGATSATGFGNLSVYLPNYTTSNIKSFSVDAVQENNTNTAYMNVFAGYINTTNAVTSLGLTPIYGTAFLQYTTATLYGVFSGPETFPSVPTIGVATVVSGTSVSVPFTPTSATGVDANYTALSTPGSITATGTSSPITVTGLTTGTAYTFQVRANNPGGSSAYSAASNSVTPIFPTSYESIATINVGSGGAVNATFNSIPQTYTHLQLRVMGKSSYSGTGLVNGGIVFNGDTSGSNNSCHNLYGDGSVADSQGQSNYNGMAWYFPTSGENGWGVAIFDILNYTDTNINKTARGLTGVDNNGSGRMSLTSTNWRNTAAITSITLLSEPLWVQYSTFCLYGIKGS